MTYAVTALTATGQVDVHSTSVAAIRQALADARQQSATNVSLSRDGKSIEESQLGAPATTATVSVGEALASSAAGRGAGETFA